MKAAFSPTGVHLLADLHGVDAALLADGPRLERILRQSAQEAGAHILSGHFHSFGEEAGITGVLLLAESHISIHTWPEAGFLAADIFMCGQAEPDKALQVLRDALAPAHCSVHTLSRGLAAPAA